MANRKSWRRAVASSPTPRPTTKQTSPAFAGVADPALNNLLSVLVARQVSVRTIDGAEYTGLFYGTASSGASSTLCLILRYARATSGTFNAPATSTDVRAGIARSLSLPVAHVALLRATTPFAASNHSSKAFATDTQIARGGARPGRILQRFDDFNEMGVGNDKPLDEQTYGDLAVNGTTKWDQFQVNHDKFGVTTTFDEDEYTTKIDRADVNFAEREREAARLAEEINAKVSDNVHMRQERNQELGGDYDEEMLHSSVVRTERAKARTATSVGRSTSQAPASSRPAPQALLTARAIPQPTAKETPKETKRSTYAAVAASSVKTPAGMPAGSSKNTTQQHQVSSSVAAAPLGTKPTASGGAVSAASAGKSGSMRLSSSSTSSTHAGVSQSKAAAHSKAVGSTKAAAPVKSNAQVKSGQPSKTPASVKASPTTSSTPVATSTSSKQKQGGYKPTDATVDNKERDLLEKKSKPAGPRDRSSRENLPQLAKVRASITGRTSPNQSRNSPLASPASTKTLVVANLNLDTQVPNLGPEQIKRFEKYKTNREIQSIAQNREKITDDLRKISTQLDSKSGPSRRVDSTPNSSGALNTAIGTEKKATEAISKTDGKVDPLKAPEQKPAEDKKTDTTSDETIGQDSAATKHKSKIKSKLNPNAQEFKMNPDALSFTPHVQEQPQMSNAPQTYNSYGMGPMMPDYSQSMQGTHQAYPVPMQAMGQIPYSQPYGVLLQGTVPSAPNSAYQFLPPASFAPSQMAGRFPQNTGAPVSYGYGQINPTMPMVMASGLQRIPPNPYPYYNSGPYPGGQVGGGQQIPSQAQQHMFVPGNQAGGLGHLQTGNMVMSGRGGYAHARRGGGRRGGKHQSQHGIGGTNGISIEKAVPKATENVVAAESSQR